MSRAARLARYENDYDESYGYEARLVEARSAITAEWLLARAPERVVEVGCGLRPLFARVAPPSLARWVVVEPSARFAEAARERALGAPALRVVEGFFESSVVEIRAALGGPADVVVIDSLLHELDDADALLTAARALLHEDGALHVNVPNALSMHRRLARAMGLIGDVREVSERGARLSQARVYDPRTLRESVEAAGFEVFDAGGHTIKPFTHAQMERLEAELGPDVLDGLARLADELPELSAEIHVRARPAARLA